MLKPLLAHLDVLYAPPYSPMLNPIEEYFNVFKQNYRAQISKGAKNHLQIIANAAKSIKDEVMKKFYNDIFPFFLLA